MNLLEDLQDLVEGCPNQIEKLNELGQAQLARRVEPARPPKASDRDDKSVRSKGSTESLKPEDEPAAHPFTVTTPPPRNIKAATAPTPVPDSFQAPAQSTSTSSAAAAQPRTAQKHNRTESSLARSGGGLFKKRFSAPGHRFDGEVQSFCDGLDKFISVVPNTIRKMEKPERRRRLMLKVTEEIPASDDEDNHELESGSRETTTTAALEATRSPTLDELAAVLKEAQTQCRKLAHQFLRGVDCSGEIVSLKKHLAKASDLAGEEIKRMGF